MNRFPLTAMQDGILYETLRAPGDGAYLVQIVLDAPEPIDAACLSRALADLVARHEALRLAFHRTETGTAMQEFQTSCPIAPVLHDWSGQPEEGRAGRMEALLRQDREASFAIGHAPLLRVLLVRHGAQDFTLVLTYHHLILDGRSHARLVQELLAGYEAPRRGSHAPLPAAGRFGDYLAWRAGLQAEAAMPYWRSVLQGFDAPTPLPGAHARRDLHGGQARRGRVERRLSVAATDALGRLAARCGFTVGTVMQGAWAMLLGGHGGVDDVVFGRTHAGRGPAVPGADDTLGVLIGTVPVRCRIDRGAEVAAWLTALRAEVLAARAHEHVSLVNIKAASAVPAGEPLFETVMIFEREDPAAPLRALGERWRGWHMRVLQETPYPLMLMGYGGDALSFVIAYDRDRIADGMADRMARYLEALLTGIAGDAGRTLGALMAAATQAAGPSLADGVRTPAGARAATFPELFRYHAERAPDRLAVVCGEAELTYGELDARAARLARVLRTGGMAPGAPVGLFLDRTADLAVGILGILRAGGAYVPLDPAYPAARIGHMLRESGAGSVVTMAALRSSLPAGCEIICLDALPTDMPAREPERASRHDDVAYIIFTSGSTGVPKGIAVEHGSLANLLDHATNALFAPGELDMVGATASIAFDASISQIFSPLASGGAVALADNLLALPASPAYRRITYFGAVPSVLEAFLCDHPLPDGLRVLGLGAAHASERLLRMLRARWRPGLRLINLYGPTETTVYCTAADLTVLMDGSGEPGSERSRVIGKPIRNVRACIVDAGLEPVPLGATGELCIAGACLARGYVNQPVQTAERFLAVPSGEGLWARMYRTGDVARFNEDGDLELFGRLDNQVKVRGHRIEIEEIEAVLDDHAAVDRSALALVEKEGGEAALVAYLVAATPDSPPPADVLRRHLAERLPRYMIPQAFLVLDRMPLTPAGKVDRKALPDPGSLRPAPGPGPEGPLSDLERRVLAIWRKVLARDGIALDDDFFALGGDSIQAMQIVMSLEEDLGGDADLNGFFVDPTPRGCLALVGRPEPAP